MKQIITTIDCKNCPDPCCRFSPSLTEYSPIFSREEVEKIIKKGYKKSLFSYIGNNVFQLNLSEKEGEFLLCPLLKEDKKWCAVYDINPFYCNLWPFGLMKGYKEDKKNIYLVIDHVENCPAIKKVSKEKMKNYINYLKEYLESDKQLKFLKNHVSLIKNFDTDFKKIFLLKKLTKEVNGA